MTRRSSAAALESSKQVVLGSPVSGTPISDVGQSIRGQRSGSPRKFKSHDSLRRIGDVPGCLRVVNSVGLYTS
jgi:hypothetical protein